jgi:hypothetical protein
MKEGSLAHVSLSSQHNTSSRTHLLYAYFDGMVSRWVKRTNFRQLSLLTFFAKYPTVIGVLSETINDFHWMAFYVV